MNYLFIFLLITITGCLPLKQSNVTGGRQYDGFLYDGWEPYALLQIGPSNVPKSFTFQTADCYAIAPGGKRFNLSIEPHDYDLRPDKDARVPYVRDRIYLADAKGQRIMRKWKNGVWRFHFALVTPTGPDTRDFEVELGTFNYNPVIHGPPN